ncbi:MAG: hypothetical protein JWN21_1458 [Sphingomonas bacterium]|nr:hypothetical protein [Sphingomonas bacterium]
MRRDVNCPIPNPSTLVARRCTLLILSIVGLDLGFVLLARAMGWSTASLLPLSADLFGDYFKFILAFPGGDAVQPSTLGGLGERIARYQASGDYAGVEGLARNQLTTLHVTPITALFCLINVQAMTWVDPVLLFAAQLVALAGWWIALAMRQADSRREGMFWALAGLACYPAAMVLLRGNLYAGAAGLLIIHSMLTVLRQPESPKAAVLLALACCIRPNAVAFLLPLFALTAAGRVPMLIRFGATGAVVTLVALWGAHALHPGYTLQTFHAALRIYYDMYVVHDLGVAYGSSTFGALKLVFGFRPGLDTLALLPAALIALATAALAWRQALRPSSLLFLTAAAYTLGSTIFADYHLLPFVLPILLLAREHEGGTLDDRARAVMICSCLILAPKNLAFSDQFSGQVVANPLILIAGSIQIIWEEWKAHQHHRAAPATGEQRELKAELAGQEA